MVLADNVDGGDDLDLIVTTMNGNVFCFSTPSPHHPLKVLNNIIPYVFLLLVKIFDYIYQFQKRKKRSLISSICMISIAVMEIT